MWSLIFQFILKQLFSFALENLKEEYIEEGLTKQFEDKLDTRIGSAIAKLREKPDPTLPVEQREQDAEDSFDRFRDNIS